MSWHPRCSGEMCVPVRPWYLCLSSKTVGKWLTAMEYGRWFWSLALHSSGETSKLPFDNVKCSNCKKFHALRSTIVLFHRFVPVLRPTLFFGGVLSVPPAARSYHAHKGHLVVTLCCTACCCYSGQADFQFPACSPTRHDNFETPGNNRGACLNYQCHMQLTHYM